LGNILQLWSPQGHYRAQREFLGNLLIDDVREADGVGLGQFLETGSNVNPVPKYISILLHDVAQMNANTDVNLGMRFCLSVMSPQSRLNLLSALHGVNHRREVYQEGIPDRLDDRAVMCGDSLLDNPVMDSQQSQHAGLVTAHLAAKAHDVGKHDRG